MAQKVLSISMGSEIVKVCEVKLAGKKKVQVYNAIDLVIPEGLCEDGVIQNVDELATAILDGLEGEGFTSKKIVFTLASKRIASKEAVIPYCKENRIKEIIEVNAAEYFPIANLEDYVVSYSILETVQNESVKNYRLSVVATPIDLLDGYYELARAMGMSVVTIDYSGNSSLQLLKLQTVGSEVDAIMQMGSENTIVNIMDGQTMVMQRSVPYGRSSLMDAVKSYRLVPDSVADAILIEENIAALASESVEVADAVRALFSSINRIIEFYTSRYSDRPIEHIYMIGDILSVNGLVELFNREWDYEVQIIAALNGIEIKNHRNVSDEIAANYIANIGAVIAPMNICRKDDKQAAKDKGLPWWLLIVSVVAAAAMVGGVLFVYFAEKADKDFTQSQIDMLGDVEDLSIKCEQANSDLQKMKEWYETTKSPNESLAKFIGDLEQIQPSDVAVNRFTLSDGVFLLEGSAKNRPAVAQFLIELKKLPYVTNVRINYLTENVLDYSKVQAFEISLLLQYTSVDDENDSAEAAVDEDLDMLMIDNMDESVPYVEDGESYEDLEISDDEESFEDEDEDVDEEVDEEEGDEEDEEMDDESYEDDSDEESEEEE